MYILLITERIHNGFSSATYKSIVLEKHPKTSRVQYVLRCKQHLECVDVAFLDDKVSLLFGNPGPAAGVDEINGNLKNPLSIMLLTHNYIKNEDAEDFMEKSY